MQVPIGGAPRQPITEFRHYNFGEEQETLARFEYVLKNDKTSGK